MGRFQSLSGNGVSFISKNLRMDSVKIRHGLVNFQIKKNRNKLKDYTMIERKISHGNGLNP